MEEQKISELWHHLHWLSVLAQQGSYTAAAARLGVSKAAMSQRIAELERAARVPLVQRTTRSVRLTEAGQRLVDDTRASFEQIEHSFAQVRDLAGVPSGLLRVTAPVAFARQQLAPRLADFLREYPDVRLELDMSDRLSSLATEGFDLAIRHTDLQAHNCLHYLRAQDTPTWTLVRTTGKAKEERVTVPVTGQLAANNSEALREAALTGLGIALLPDFSAQAALQQGKLVQVLSDWQPVGAFAEQLYAIRPYSPHVPRAVTAFVDYLRKALAEGFAA